MIEHIQRVRAVDPYMHNATAVIALESNLGYPCIYPEFDVLGCGARWALSTKA